MKNTNNIMEEAIVLENALKSCEYLQSTLKDSLKTVRRLNLRYNLDWFVKNYNTYIGSIWEQYKIKFNVNSKLVDSHIDTANSDEPSKSNTSPLHNIRLYGKSLSARSSSELLGGNAKINYKFIRIKRSLETVLLQIQRAIDIANRQRNYMHLNQNVNQSKSHICCH